MAKKPIKQHKTANLDTREQRRKTIAAGVVAQKPMTAIAREVGLSRELTSRIANAPETKDLIRSMLAPHHKRLERIVDKAITTVERALEDDSEDRAKRIKALKMRIAQIADAIKAGNAEPRLLREIREHEKQLASELNDYTPNLKAVERAKDLLELMEGKKQDGEQTQTQYRQTFVGMDGLLAYYRELVLAGRPSLP